ncbi:MAG: HPP family protein [Haloarculaceae archaeon]
MKGSLRDRDITPVGEKSSTALRDGGVAGLLLAVPAGLAWLVGLPLLFPSLGPSAYVLATRPEAPTARPRRVIGGHAVGVVAGLVAYHAVASPSTLTALPATRTPALAALVAAGTLSVVATTAGMVATDLRHAPACATTLIVALGLLSTPTEGVLVMVAVVALVGVQVAVETLIE